MMPATADFSFRFGDGVVITGDSPGTIVRKAGRQPDRIVQLENRHGAAVGERWEYYLDNKQVNFEIREGRVADIQERSEEHTSELQSLMRISYAVFCLKKKNTTLYTHLSLHLPTTTKTLTKHHMLHTT